MRKNLLILLTSLLLPMWCSSQTMYPKLTRDSLIVITPQQLKTTNLIFLEHKKLKAETVQLYTQLEAFDLLLYNSAKVDSIKNLQIYTLMANAKESDVLIQKQATAIVKKDRSNRILRGVAIGGFVVGIGGIILLIVK